MMAAYEPESFFGVPTPPSSPVFSEEENFVDLFPYEGFLGSGWLHAVYKT